MNNTELYFFIQNIATFIVIGFFVLLIVFLIIINILDKLNDLINKFKRKNKESEK